jgi:hypothetical protein
MNEELQAIIESDIHQHPEMRPIEAVPVSVMGRKMFLVRDPARISHKSVMLNPKTLFLVSLFDGSRHLKEIQASYNRKFGEIITMDRIMDIVFELDCAMFIRNSRFKQYLEFLQAEFLQSRFRECMMCGEGYPKEPEKLREMIDGYFQGLPGDDTTQAPMGVASPHIDFARGGPTYAAAYRQLAKSNADTFVIFGTSHASLKNIISITGKTFRTPLGDLPPDVEFIEKLKSHSSTGWQSEEFAHRGEHSIEFQAVMLRYIFPGRQLAIVPILVGSMDGLDGAGGTPLGHPQVEEFTGAFSRAIQETGRKPAFIAGVDFAHVGPQFGDSLTPDFRRLQNIKQDEIESIAFLEKGDPEGFYRHVAAEQQQRRVCGLAPLYLMSRVMGSFRGKLLEYNMCSDPDRAVNVGVAAIAFYPGEPSP